MAGESRQRYYIPGNFIEEGHIFLGKFRLRYFIEAVIFGGAFGLIALFILSFFPQLGLQTKVSIGIVAVVPPFCLGIVGYNGDPLSIAARDAIDWCKERRPMLYNPHPRLLADQPLEIILNSENAQDKLVDLMEGFQSKRMERRTNMSLVEGDDFEFATDPDIDYYLESDKGKGSKRRRKRGQAEPEEPREKTQEELSYEEIDDLGDEVSELSGATLFQDFEDAEDEGLDDDALEDEGPDGLDDTDFEEPQPVQDPYGLSSDLEIDWRTSDLF